MAYPIQYALTYPKREVGIFPPFDFSQYSCFSFFSPDIERFPGLHLAQESLRMGCSTPTYFNAANEVLVERFLHREISWCAITQLLEKLLYRHKKIPLASLEAILYVDQEARKEARIA
jgi:1-deoxy-D-xylulose-5-phosphate reductoisomerase